MAEFEDVMPKGVFMPSSGGINRVAGVPTTAWFEFILDATLLEKHLNNPNSGLSATELISLFLYQADIALATVKEIENKEGIINGSCSIQPSLPSTPEEKSSAENRKVQMLRLLALKTACHLKWNLEFLHSSLPLAILKSLLVELLKVVANSENFATRALTEENLQQMEPDALFAVVLYHRWCLTSLIHESFPTKPSKTPNVQVPGLLDPSISSAGLKDSILKSLRENVDNSVMLLENLLSLGRPARMPVMGCFGTLKGDSISDKMANDWTRGITINEMEMTCQIAFDLGCYFFFLRNYEKANASFAKCKELIDKIQKPVFCSVDVQRLDGYLCACTGVLSASMKQPFSSLYRRVQMSVRNNFQGLTGLLIEDLTKQELSFAFRVALAESTQAAHRHDSLYEEVVVCNSIRWALDGRVAMFDLVMTLNRTLGLVDFFVKVCVDIHKVLSDEQKDNLKFFLSYLCQMIAPETHFIDLLLSSELQTLFTASERLTFATQLPASSAPDVSCTSLTLPQPVEESMKVAELERELLVTYDPGLIKELVQKLISRIGKYQTVFLSDKWRIPRDLHQLIETLPIPQPVTPVFVHILVAKARICIQIKQFEKARELLNLAETTIHDISLKLLKLLRLEILRVDLLQLFDAPQFAYAGNFPDLGKRVKSCIQTFQQVDNESLPSPELMSACIAFLLNTQDFDYLCGLNNGNANGFVQFGRMVAALCKEIPLLKTARTSAREFIDAVRQIFVSSVQTKRGNSGAATSIIMRENNASLMSPDALVTLMCMIKEPIVLSLFVSCLTKLFNLMKDDISEEIYSDYITLWPTALSSSNTPLNEPALSDAVISLMKYVLSVNPSQPSWLRTQADLSYANGDFFSSLRHYLLLGIVSTDYFTEPITKNVYDDQVYRRMIRCCASMNCHTQVAVLCQFLDETDYTIAFKSLQERSCDDAMDAYYECIWDPTILEFLIHLHNKRGEVEKRQHALQLIGQMELNSSNRPEILMEAAKLRKGRFMRALAKQYLSTDS